MSVRTFASGWIPSRWRRPGRPEAAPVVGGASGERSAPFTDYLSSLGPQGDPPTPLAFQRVRRQLRTALVAELKRRGLWEAPPTYVGVLGAASWSSTEGAWQRDRALEELVADSYAFIFVERLGSLLAQLRVKPNVEGLVRLNIRHFLHERQREHDPIGFRVFEALRNGLRDAVEEGEMKIVEGDPRIRGDTVLEFTSGPRAPTGAGSELAAIVRGWGDELLPELVTAQGRARLAVAEKLRRLLSQLRETDWRSFRVKDLLDPLKQDVRARWGALFEAEVGEAGGEGEGQGLRELVRRIEPSRQLEERDSFRALVNCVGGLIAELRAGGSTHRHLETLWGFLRAHALAGEGDALPSQRKLAVWLGVPRDRLPALYETLARFVERCLRSLAAPSTGQLVAEGT